MSTMILVFCSTTLWLCPSLFLSLLCLSLQTTTYLSEVQFAIEPPETLDPLYKFHETIAKVES